MVGLIYLLITYSLNYLNHKKEMVGFFFFFNEEKMVGLIIFNYYLFEFELHWFPKILIVHILMKSENRFMEIKINQDLID